MGAAASCAGAVGGTAGAAAAACIPAVTGVIDGIENIAEGVGDIDDANNMERLNEVATGATPLTFDPNVDMVLDEWPSIPESGGNDPPAILCDHQFMTGCANATITAQLGSMVSPGTQAMTNMDVGRAIDLLGSAIDSAVRRWD